MIRMRLWLTTLIIVMAATMLLVGCSSNPNYYRSDLQLDETATLAVLPLVNLSKYTEASEIVMNSLLVELLDLDVFEIVDPGIVDEVILQKRIRYTDRLPMETMQELGSRMGASYLLLGSIHQFDMITDRVEILPVISISLRIVGSETGTIVWAATHTKRGDDTESIFGLGRIDTLERLTAVTVKEITGTLKK